MYPLLNDASRYNLKRRVASLPPISSEVFNEKVLTAQATSNAAAAKATFQKTCTVCQKTYFSENAYHNHLGSQKHKLRWAAASQKGNTEETDAVASPTGPVVSPSDTISSPVSERDPEAEAEFEKIVDGLREAKISDPLSSRPSRPYHSSEEERREEHPLSPPTTVRPATLSETRTPEIPLSRCLFCNYDSPTFKLSIEHMTKIHGLFIPEQNYLVDLEGLIRYFQAKISEYHECLFCHKLKTSTIGVQTHMRDKGHCMVAFETEEEMIEVGQFYDFSSTYSDTVEDEDEETDIESTSRRSNGGVKLPKEGDVEVGEGADDSWETDSSFSSLDSADLASVPIDDHSHQYERLAMHRHHSHTDARPHRSADGYHSHAHHGTNAVFHDDYELHLPNGRTVGHRSLRRYYRQNLHAYPSAAERQEKAQRLIEKADDDDDEMEDIPDSPKMHRVQAVARRHEGGLLGATSAQRRYVASAEKRDRRHAENAQNRFQAKVEKQKNSQKHYRVS